MLELYMFVRMMPRHGQEVKLSTCLRAVTSGNINFFSLGANLRPSELMTVTELLFTVCGVGLIQLLHSVLPTTTRDSYVRHGDAVGLQWRLPGTITWGVGPFDWWVVIARRNVQSLKETVSVSQFYPNISQMPRKTIWTNTLDYKRAGDGQKSNKLNGATWHMEMSLFVWKSNGD